MYQCYDSSVKLIRGFKRSFYRKITKLNFQQEFVYKWLETNKWIDGIEK